MKPTLTIITPVKNGEAYIEGCVRNVLSQRLPDIEHLIIDGDSTDNTKKIVGELAIKHPNIIFHNEPGSSQAEAMNKGIALANAPIIGFLNVDDFYEPKALQRAMRIIQKQNSPSLVAGNCNILGPGDAVTKVNKPTRFRFTDILAGREFPYNPAAYFYHKSIHETIGPYDPKDHYVMDLDFLLRAVQSANILYVDELWGNFRFIEGTKTFGESEEGRMYERCDAVREKYYEQASALQKFVVKTKRFADRLNRKLSR